MKGSMVFAATVMLFITVILLVLVALPVAIGNEAAATILGLLSLIALFGLFFAAHGVQDQLDQIQQNQEVIISRLPAPEPAFEPRS